MNDLLSAYLNWVHHAPEACCCNKPHFYKTEHYQKRGVRTQVVTLLKSLPDSQVCLREQAWRRYISLRDRIDYAVPDQKVVNTWQQ